jgi:brefeldin A-inhibited guanine nucleotide-exchange protein
MQVFRALCKLSSKELPEAPQVDSLEMRSKILSLEMIVAILERAGPALQGSDRFIKSAIKKHLVVALLTNGLSPVPRVFHASLSIFSTLVTKFKDQLKVSVPLQASFSCFFSRMSLASSLRTSLSMSWRVRPAPSCNACW